MYGDKAFDLIKELDRSAVDTVPLYNADAVRQILEEVRNLYERNQEDVNASVSGDLSHFSSLHLRHAALERNKRCLLAYLYHRLKRIRELRWDFGSVLPPEVTENLCEQEVNGIEDTVTTIEEPLIVQVQWLNSYNTSLAAYMTGLGGDEFGLDLTQDTRPPKSLFLEVRCTQDYGLLELEDGDVVMLKKDTTHLLPRSECLPLIRQGILEHIPH